MSAEEDKFQEEWQRALNNPDNMIVSDSLISRLGGDDLQEEAPTDSFLQCTIMSDDGQVISGRTASFEQTSTQSFVAFETTHATANTMLRFGVLERVLFSLPGADEEVTWAISEGDEVSRKTEFFAQNDALVTITITKQKETRDPNSYTITMEDPTL